MCIVFVDGTEFVVTTGKERSALLRECIRRLDDPAIAWMRASKKDGVVTIESVPIPPPSDAPS